MQRAMRHIGTGVLTIVPLTVTVWIVWFVVELLIGMGRPIVAPLAALLRSDSPLVADLLVADWFQSALAMLVTLAGLYLLGRAANAAVGRWMLRLLGRMMAAIPFARTVYNATQKLIDALKGDNGSDGQQVVLIEFPTPEMRAIGLVTRIFPATEAQEELAAVYVPTTPNPTSGFVEIVPTRRLVFLDWSKSDAMAFIVSGGAMAPGGLSFQTGPDTAGGLPCKAVLSEGA